MPAGVADDIGKQLLAYGRRIPKDEMFARIDAVTPEVIKAVADRRDINPTCILTFKFGLFIKEARQACDILALRGGKTSL